MLPLVLLAVVLGALALAAPAGAVQTERIADGGFEANVCGKSMGSCTNPSWTVERKSAFLCRIGICPESPASGAAFLSLDGYNPTTAGDGTEAEAIQTVKIPEAPAVLTFSLAVEQPAKPATFSLRVVIAGESTPVNLEKVSAAYSTVTLNVAKFVQGAPEEFKFEASCLGGLGERCPTMDIDNVSLLTGTPPPPPPGGGGGQGGGPVAPDTTILSGPAKRTTSHQARFTFKSSIGHSKFKCSLDGAAFSTCISPRILQVGKGLHLLKVRAVAGGVADPSPASYSWKVVKKHHRHGHRHH